MQCAGDGRRTLTQADPGLLEALERLVEPARGATPCRRCAGPARAPRKLAEELTRQDHPDQHRTVATLLKRGGYSLQANRKTREGASHPDRNAQFEYINAKRRAIPKRRPAGDLGGHEEEGIGRRISRMPAGSGSRQGTARRGRVHDFLDKKLGKAIPYGVYDLASNEGWVSVGIDHDTAEFACASIHRWWKEMGSPAVSTGQRLLITADGGGSNSSRNRLWKKSVGCGQELSHFRGQN